MARVVVVEPELDAESPFLRGILTRSLQDAGVDFDLAYRISSVIRQRLLHDGDTPVASDLVRVTSRTLQAMVLRELRRTGLGDPLKRYRSRRTSAAPIDVAHRDGNVTPFSRAHLQRGLQSCGLSMEEAATVTISLYEQLVEEGRRIIDSVELDGLTHHHLESLLGDAVARRYLMWRDFVLSGRPLLLLIGGVAGCGKSTVATAIASRLEIVRTQSTDMLREVMRVMVPKRLLPVLHASSFDAWRPMPRAGEDDVLREELLIDGFRAQADLISVACEAVAHRAIRERVSLILEGVHVQPAMLDRLRGEGDALVVPVMLAVLNPETLRGRIRGRGSETPGRRSARYLDAFDDIWRLQSHLLAEADRVGIPIVGNTGVERVFVEIMRIVIDRLAENFTRRPDEVFTQVRSPPLQLAHG